MNGNNHVVVTTSWDDGHPLDVKLAELLSKFGISGTFYVATQNKERPVIQSGALRELGQHFEIGAHTRTHVKLTKLEHKALDEEIRGSKMELENILGNPVNMFCYPRGIYNLHVRLMVKNAGFIGARTTREFHVDLGKDAWLMPTTLQSFPHLSWTRIRHGVKTTNWRGLKEFFRIGFPLCQYK